MVKRDEYRHVWRKAQIFAGLDLGYLDLFASDSLTWPFDEGEEVVKEGTNIDHIYIVQAGTVAVVKEDDDGHQTELAVLGPGQVFGEISLVLDGPTTASIVGKNAGTCLMISKQVFDQVMQREAIAAIIYKNLSRILAERLKATSQKAEDLDDKLQRMREQQPAVHMQ